MIKICTLLRKWASSATRIKVVCGPFFSNSGFEELQKEHGRDIRFDFIKVCDSILPLLQSCWFVVSRCGYNTAYEASVAGKPIVFFPREGSREQVERATALSDRAGAQVVMPGTNDNQIVQLLDVASTRDRVKLDHLRYNEHEIVLQSLSSLLAR